MKVYIKIKNLELNIPVINKTMANFITKIAHKLGQKYDLMFYQVYILED